MCICGFTSGGLLDLLPNNVHVSRWASSRNSSSSFFSCNCFMSLCNACFFFSRPSTSSVSSLVWSTRRFLQRAAAILFRSRRRFRFSCSSGDRLLALFGRRPPRRAGVLAAAADDVALLLSIGGGLLFVVFSDQDPFDMESLHMLFMSSSFTMATCRFMITWLLLLLWVEYTISSSSSPSPG